MSIAVLVQVQDDVRRLAIAGSAVAAGDFRLQKSVPPLEKSGEKAPVFAKVARAVRAVVDSDETHAASALLELATLVNAILYTQGETGVDGEIEPLPGTPLDLASLGGVPTPVGGRTLKPLFEALRSTGSGRLELIRDAVDRGAFRDLRLVWPAVHAIDDPYAEIGQLVAERVLPLYGPAVVPLLRDTLDLKGRGGHVHRLRLLHRLDPHGSRDVVRSALADGSREMKVVAIECFGTTGDDLACLLEHAQSKSKDVRAAALSALSVCTDADADANADVVRALKAAVAGPDLDLIIGRVSDCAIPAVRGFVLTEAERQLAAVLAAKDKAAQAAAVGRMMQLITCLSNRRDAEAEAFLVRCFDTAPALAAIKSEPSGGDLNERVAHVLAGGTPTMQRRLVAAHASLRGGMLPPAIVAARAIMTPAEFYDAFGPLLGGLSAKRTKANAVQLDRGKAVLDLLTSGRYAFAARGGDGPGASPVRALDPRWLDSAIDGGATQLVCDLARAGHARSARFLANQLAKAKHTGDARAPLHAMIRIGHPDATDALVRLLKRQVTEATYSYYVRPYGPLIAALPKRSIGTIEALLATLPETMVDVLTESVLVLKNKVE